MSMSVSVCLSARISPEPHARSLSNLFKFVLHVAYDRGSVLLRRRCDTLCTSGLWMTSHFSIIERMNFATKNQFCLNLHIYRKFGQNSISYY